MNKNIEELVESINKLSTKDLEKLGGLLEEIGAPMRRMERNKKLNRRNERLYMKLYHHYSISDPNGEYENIPESENEVQKHAMVVLGRTNLTMGEINACKDIYNEFNKIYNEQY